MNRLESLDWLRGLLALSIMLYHLTCWTAFEPDASEVMGRLGIYGVSMFFILSGLSMAEGYRRAITDLGSWGRFFLRRVFRIWPLLWMAVGIVTVAGVVIKHKPIDWAVVLLNITTLFGFVSPGAYVNTGAWSIGNEMVYYALTPALLALYNHRLGYGNAVVAVTIAVGLVFGFHWLTPEQTLASQWQLYIHPMNNLFFYCAGIAVACNAHTVSLSSRTLLLVLASAVAAFAAFPAGGDLINIVTGLNRVLFFLVSATLVLCFYKMRITPPAWASRPLATLGVATYGVYLLHPIVFKFVELAAKRVEVGTPAVVLGTVMLTIALSIATYRFFETPFIRLGKRLTPSTRAAQVGGP